MHGGSPSVIGLAGKAKYESRLADDAFDDGQRQTFGLQHRTLFDVDFDEAQHIVAQRSIGNSLLVRSEGSNRVVHANSVCILIGEHRLIEDSSNSPTAEERHSVSHSFFF